MKFILMCDFIKGIGEYVDRYILINGVNGGAYIRKKL